MSFYVESRLRPGEKVVYQPEFSRFFVVLAGIAAVVVFPLTAYFLLRFRAVGLLICLAAIYFIFKYFFDYFHAALAVTGQRIVGRVPRVWLAFSLKPVDLPLAGVQEVYHATAFGGRSAGGVAGQIADIGSAAGRGLADYGTVVVADKAGRLTKIRSVAGPGELNRAISQAAGLAAAPISAPAPGIAPGPAPAAGPPPAEPAAAVFEPATPSPGQPGGPTPAASQAPGVAEQALARRTDWKPVAVLLGVLLVIAGLTLWHFSGPGKPGKKAPRKPPAKTTKTANKTPVPGPKPEAPKAAATAPDQPLPRPAAKAPSSPPAAAAPPASAAQLLQQAIKEKDTAKKIELYSKVIELDRYNYAALNNRGNGYYLKGELDKAMRDYNEALQLKPDFPEAYNGRGNVYYDRREDDLALADYNKAIAIKPNYTLAYFNRGNTYFRRKDYEQALSDFSKALELNPKYAIAYSARGNVYFTTKNYDLALQDYDRAIAHNPDYAWAYYRRALIYQQKGDAEQARRNYDKAKSLNPKLPDLAIK